MKQRSCIAAAAAADKRVWKEGWLTPAQTASKIHLSFQQVVTPKSIKQKRDEVFPTPMEGLKVCLPKSSVNLVKQTQAVYFQR